MTRILLVDDDKFLLDMYAKKFQGAGFEVETMGSAEDALGAIEGGLETDVVVTDVTMPNIDGFAFLEALKEKQLLPNAIKIMLTNQSSDEEIKRGQAAGAEEYIIKATLIPSEVVEAVQKVIDKHK